MPEKIRQRGYFAQTVLKQHQKHKVEMDRINFGASSTRYYYESIAS
jgi:hypothetical protein